MGTETISNTLCRLNFLNIHSYRCWNYCRVWACLHQFIHSSLPHLFINSTTFKSVSVSTFVVLGIPFKINKTVFFQQKLYSSEGKNIYKTIKSNSKTHLYMSNGDEYYVKK